MARAKKGSSSTPKAKKRGLVFSTNAWEDYLHWQSTDAKILERINTLIKETLRTPFNGIGKPEALKHVLKGCWSHRIDHTNRMVYRVTKTHIEILQLRYHY